MYIHDLISQHFIAHCYDFEKYLHSFIIFYMLFSLWHDLLCAGH